MVIFMISEKQVKILAFPYSKYNALICDGAVRSGKTSIMSVSFVDWAMREFSDKRFGICGKTVDSCVKNIIIPYIGMTYVKEKYQIQWRRSDKILEVKKGKRVNVFEVFGGKDESSAALIQGRTLAGVMLDEVALMPRSFVEQALARCSISGAKLWFNCNPENPLHWFRQEWILKAPEKNALHLHFLMEDNPSLSEETLNRYKNMYSGVFYERYILGRWVMSEGLIYDMFDQTDNVYREMPAHVRVNGQRIMACDYGTTNPCVFLEIYDDGELICVEREYRWDSRKEHRQKTDAEYGADYLDFAGENDCAVIVDPSAASFIAELRSRGVLVQEADNDVLDGIRRTGSLLHRRKLLVNERCAGLIDELGTYLWDDKAAMRGEEKPVKQNDHACDALRYYVNSLPDWRFE